MFNETIIKQTDQKFLINAASKLYTQIKNRIYFFKVDEEDPKKCHKMFFDLKNPKLGLQRDETIKIEGTICGFVFSDKDLENTKDETFSKCFNCEEKEENHQEKKHRK
jgi:hypothetical protein